MNIYNLQDFKCGFCTKWFHPHNSLPYSLPCSHSICATCIKSQQKKSKTSINCIHHNTPQALVNLKINKHIQQVLQRLLKNQSPSSVPVKKMYERKNELESLLNQKKEDLRAFTELLEQIYNNQINRILSLKKRVLREVTDSSVSFTQWSKNIQCKDQYEIEQEGKVVEEKIRQFCQLNIEEMAQIIIADPAICLQRQFSIYNLIKKQERKTLKSSVQHNERFPNRSLLSSFVQPNGKQNIYLNIKTVNSPIERSNDSEHCKQLSSFKLEDSRSSHQQYSRLDLQSNALKRLSYKQSEFCQQNGDTTLRDTQQFQSKVVIKQREKRMSDKLQDLISSLKPNKDHEQLIYSPDNQSFEEELLLSNTKHDVNFLRQHQFEHKPSQKSMQIRQRPVISSERQKNKYVKRMETVRTEQAYYNTNIIGNTIELFNCDLKQVNLKALLDRFDWKEIQVIKLIGTGLQDKQLNQLLNYMIDSRVHSLLLSNNELQEISLDAILRFTEINKSLKTVSLQKNNIHQLHTNAKAKLALLKQRGVVLYI